MRIRLFPKFLIFITLIAIVPLIVIGVLTININREMLQTLMLEHYIKITTTLAEKIDDKIENIDRRMSFVIATQNQEYLSSFEQMNILRNVLIASDDFVRTSIIDKTGNEIMVANPKFGKNEYKPKNYSKDKYFLAIKKTQRYQVSPLYYEREHPIIDFYFILINKYILKVSISLDNIAEIVEETNVGATGHVFIIDNNGKVILHKQKELAISNEDLSTEQVVKEAIMRAGVGSKEYKSNGGIDMIGAYAPVKRLPWSVIFQQNKNEAYSSMIKMRRNAMITIIIALLFAISISYILTKSLSNPILKIINVSKSVANGDFSQRVNIKTRDEMHDLAENFSEMINKLSIYTKMQADKLSAIVYSINDGLILTEENNRIVLLNDKAAKILNIPKDSKASLFEIVKNEKLSNALKQISEKPDTIKEVDLSSDKPFIISVSTQIITDPMKKTVVGIIFIMRDVTGAKEVEKMKEDFFHGITHDLRNPLASMLGFLKFLLDGSVGQINEKQKYFLEIINRSSNRLLGMINDILDIAKLEVGRMELNLKQFDLKETAEKVCDSLMSKAIEGKIKLSSEIISTNITADESLIERVLINLVSNSLKYTFPDGKVTISSKENVENIEVSISDTGEGIPSEYLDKIFHKFQQVSGRSKGGTGIGLTITRYIIEAHFGKIWVESKLKEGSKFSFSIPKGLKKDEKGEVIV